MPSVNVPAELVRHILEGRCVAFVGAGFSGAAVPRWPQLLEEIASGHDHEKVESARALLQGKRDARTLEMAAELLQEALGKKAFQAALRSVLTSKSSREMSGRVEKLRGIPFRAVLTTNFDPFLEGKKPSPAVYRKILRPRKHRWWDEAYWEKGCPGPPIVKLHGDISSSRPSIVLGTRDYRRTLYSNPGYMTFLRTVFSTSTILYLGSSFTDAYLNELHSEVLALLGHKKKHRPVAYALMSNVDLPVRRHLRQNEGLRGLHYRSVNGDYSGFDRWLEAIHEATNPQRHLGRLLDGQRIVWVDPHPDNNAYGESFLKVAAKRECVQLANTWSEALPLIRNGTDLVLTHWGPGGATHGGETCAVAERLLIEMRRLDLRAPVLVFAGRDGAEEKRRAAMRLGAVNYVHEWSDLFSEMARILDAQVAVR